MGVKSYYRRKGLDNRCPMCQSEEDSAERALECNKGYKKFNLNDERGKEWGEIVQIYRKNKKKRSLDNIQEEQNIRQKLREDRMR